MMERWCRLIPRLPRNLGSPPRSSGKAPPSRGAEAPSPQGVPSVADSSLLPCRSNLTPCSSGELPRTTGELPRIPLLRTRVNKGSRKASVGYIEPLQGRVESSTSRKGASADNVRASTQGEGQEHPGVGAGALLQ